MIPRRAESLVRAYSQQFRAVAVVGPRQSGKTTLVRSVFREKDYVSLENPDERQFADSDPRAFLSRFPNGAVLDEAQRVPELFNYLQQILDETEIDGLFVLTGSNNFLLQESISQSLAGRLGFVDLLPLSYEELQSEVEAGNLDPISTTEMMLRGGYPEVHARHRSYETWYQAYIRSYVEWDVKQIRNIENSVTFTRFLQLCAGRVAQQLSYTALSTECGVDQRTVQAWISILQSSSIISLLQPHHANFNKRVVKTPKLYFNDTGLACALLGIRSENELANSHFKGALFENLVYTEVLKQKLNRGSSAQLYYWRDNKGLEVDLLIDNGRTLFPIEIKSAQTYQQNFARSLNQWNSLSQQSQGMIVFDGTQEIEVSKGLQMTNWKSLSKHLVTLW